MKDKIFKELTIVVAQKSDLKEVTAKEKDLVIIMIIKVTQ